MKLFLVLVLAATAFCQSSGSSSSSSSSSSSASSSLSSSFSANSSTTSSASVTTVTDYFPGCSTLPVGNYSANSTTTGTITSTLPCHECLGSNGVLTTYTTVYEEICPTGLGPKTYVITEACSETGQPRPSSYIPSGFVVTAVGCDACAEETVTLTTPAATAAASAAPLITPPPMNTSGVCHTCNLTITSVQYGEAAAVSFGMSLLTLLSSFAGALILL